MIEIVWVDQDQTMHRVEFKEDGLLNGASTNALVAAELVAKRLGIATQGLAAFRFGRRLKKSDVLANGDQIAWLATVSVDPKLARQARVEKQRKAVRRERWRRTSGLMNTGQ